jgi:hypothetical protein
MLVLRIHGLQDFDVVDAEMVFEARHKILRRTEAADEEDSLHLLAGWLPGTRAQRHLHTLPLLLDA